MRLRTLGSGLELTELPAGCAGPAGELLEVMPDPDRALPAGWRDRPLGVWKYKEFLPHHEGRDPVTMGEGGTRLLDAPRLAEWVGVKRLQLKIEGDNPTGSFKDRGMTCAVSWAVGEGATQLGCASTGNTAASMAAYAARAGVGAAVLLPAGQVAIGKVAQSLVLGARVLEVEGSFDDAMALILELAEAGKLALLNSKNPIRLEGQKTLAYEILDQREAGGAAAPDRIVYPVGNAGNISAAHRALLDYQDAGLLGADVPRLTGIQAAGAAPVAAAIAAGASEIDAVTAPETLATAIRIGRPVSAVKALRAIRETDGTATSVTDETITEAQGQIARLEGAFAEPASCASVAGLRALVQSGAVDASEEVVCVLTGNGMKDPSAAERLAAPPQRVAGTLDALLEALA
ncbi:MAG: threonine synthase [Thermoplasmatota archaeon]